jgi:hypothetical protein
MSNNEALEYTEPGSRGVCGFCGKDEQGYAKKDSKNVWQASCWACVKPEKVGASQVKRETVGTVFTEEEPPEPPKKKNPGLAPSTHRPKVL